MDYIQEGQVFDPTEITMQEGATTAPPLLTEADLIALMEKHGIGTDATHADHINTIKERGYIGEADRGSLVPGVIGMGLYESYDAMDLVLAKPMLRAEFEADLKKICLGQKDPKLILQEQIQKYKEAYKVIISKITAMDEKMAHRINEAPIQRTLIEETDDNENRIKELFICPKCHVSHMALRKKKTSGWFIGCLNFPDCKNAVWLPDEIKDLSASDENCRRCGTASKMLKVKLNGAYYRSIFNVPDGWYSTCLRCDSKFRETFNINSDLVKQVGAIVSDTTPTVVSRANAPGTSINHAATTGTSSESSQGRTNLVKAKAPVPKKKSTKQISKKSDLPQTSIRKFTTNTSTLTTIEPERHVENSDFFGSNDEFDDILGSADFEEVMRELPLNSMMTANEADEAASLLINDDWGDISWGSSHRNVNTSNPPKRVRVEPQKQYPCASSSSHENNRRPVVSQHLPNTSTYQWGSSSTHRNNGGKETIQSSSQSTSSPSVKCTGCQSSAKELTVKKDGPNKGRPFYICPKQQACNFFQWADEIQSSKEPVHLEQPSLTAVPVNEIVMCNCQVQANKLIVRKDGPNNGRWFYGCVDRNKSCGFFKWCENNFEMEQSESSWGSNPSTSAAFTKARGPSTSARIQSTSNNETKKKKCGICRQEGHTRLKCPRKAEFEI